MAPPNPRSATPGVDAFAEVYDEHSAGVFSAAQRVLRDPTLAEDVTQEVFLAYWRRPARFDAGRGPLGAYLRVMARSRALDALRASGAARRAHDRLEHAVMGEQRRTDEPPDVMGAASQRAELRAAVAGLPDPQREAVAMSFWGELSTSEIAARYELPHGTVKSRVRLGLRKLRERVDDDRVAA